MPQPAIRNSNSAASSGGAGLFALACQHRMSQSSGASHARTVRSRRGQRHRIRSRAGFFYAKVV
jgi:hypothetical protein